MNTFERIEEPIGDGEVALHIPNAPRIDRHGRLTAEVEVWNGCGRYSDTVMLSQAKARETFAEQAAPLAGEDAATITAALTGLYFKLRAEMPAPDAESGSAPLRQQQSLLAPGLVCVASDDDGQHVFVLRGDDGALTVQPSVVGEHCGERVEYVPPRALPWILPRSSAVLEHYCGLCGACGASWTSALLQDLEQWHQDASDLGRREAYLLLALYDLLTYVIEQTDYLAIICLEAEPERGKSRTGQASAAVMRHGIWLQGIREANLLRDASDRQASLFIDVMDVWKKAEDASCEDILLGRWERGGTVERVLYPDKGPFEDTVSFAVFSGGTIVATNEPIHRILDTRCLRIDMPLTSKRFAGRVQPEAARPLIERLMAWRAYVLQHGLSDADAPADGRLGDILRPLKQVLLIVAPKRIQEFDAIVTWQSTRRKDDLAASIEAAIVRAIHGQKEQGQAGYLVLGVVLNNVNRDQPEKWHKTPKWLGSKVRGLGWKTVRIGHDKHAALIWDAALLDRLAKRYGIEDDTQTPPPTPSDKAPQAPQAPRPSGEDAARCDLAKSKSAASAAEAPHADAEFPSGADAVADDAALAARSGRGAGSDRDDQRAISAPDLDAVFPPSGYAPKGRDAF
jgi:hypothetical protein